MRFVLGLILVIGLISPTLASEEEAQAAYQSYREARQSGDLRGALEHAETAYNAAIAEWGQGTLETFRYTVGLAKVQNDLLEFRAASRTLEFIVEPEEEYAEWPRYAFEAYFEAARARQGRNHPNKTRRYFRTARDIAEENYGPDSLRAGYAHMELARSHLNKDGLASGDSLRHRLIGTGYPQVAGDHNSYIRAIEIFEQFPDSVIEREMLAVIHAGNLMAEGNMDAAGEILEPAIALLAGYGYMDDYTLSLYIDWIASHLTHWPTRQMERFLLQAMEFGLLRQEGAPISLARTTATTHRRVCVDRTEGGEAVVEFSIDANGQVPRTHIVESNLPNWWGEAKRRNMRTWIYVPAQRNGEPTRVDGIRRTIVSTGSDDC